MVRRFRSTVRGLFCLVSSVMPGIGAALIAPRWAARSDRRSMSDNSEKIVVQGLTKVFGPHPSQALKRIAKGQHPQGPKGSWPAAGIMRSDIVRFLDSED